MTKRVGWRAELSKLLVEIRRKPVDFVNHDCAVGFVGPMIYAQTGIDLAEKYRGRYSNFSEGARLLKQDGFNDLADYIAANFKEIHISEAQFGDVASVPCEHPGWALGLVLGERIGVVGEIGYGTIARSEALRAFRIE